VFDHGPVRFERVVPPAGNLAVLGRQFWIGPLRAGQLVQFWADTRVIHLSIAGVRIKSVRSHLSIADLAVLTRLGARPTGATHTPPADLSDAVETERTLGSAGYIQLAGHRITVAERRAGMRVGIRLAGSTLAVFDPDTRELIRSHPNPLTPTQVITLRGAHPAGPAPTPRTDPVIVQRRIGKSGDLQICKQRLHLGREHARKTVTVHVGDNTLTIELDDGTRTIKRTNSRPVLIVKARGPRKVNTT
jgi:hypothetical protein